MTRSAFIHHWTEYKVSTFTLFFYHQSLRPHSRIASIVTSYMKFFSLSSTVKSLNILRNKNVPSWLHNANCYLWIHEQARWSESFNLIGYPRPILPAKDFPHWPCKTKLSFWPSNRSFIWPSLFSQFDWILTLIFFALLSTSASTWSIKAQKRTWPISSHLDLLLVQ